MKNYSKRSGWNGPIESLKIDQNFEWVKTISNYKKPAGLYNDEIAIVKKIKPKFIEVITKSEKTLTISRDEMTIIKI